MCINCDFSLIFLQESRFQILYLFLFSSYLLKYTFMHNEHVECKAQFALSNKRLLNRNVLHYLEIGFNIL